MTIAGLVRSVLPCLFLTAGAIAQERATDRAQPSSDNALLSLNPVARASEKEMAHFLNRPLFSASRRPAVARPVPAPLAPPPPSSPTASKIRLVGTLQKPTGATALIQDGGQGATIMVPVGGIIDGWKITGIDTSAIRIEQRGQTIDLYLFKPESRSPALSYPQKDQPDPGRRSSPSAPYAAGQTASGGPSVAQRPPEPPRIGAPAGTVAGTAAAETVANSPYRLTFGGAPSAATR